MKDYIELGPTPSGEDCEQLGPNYDSRKAVIECSAYAGQLERMFPGGNFTVKRFPHDFGTYMEVVVNYDTDSEEETDLAYDVDSGYPETWDDIAREQLAKQLADLARIV